MPDFLPQGQTQLSFWLESFTRQIVADPAAWDVKQADADELSDRYALYAAAQAVAVDPATRTSAALITRDESRDALITVVRKIAWTVRKSPIVSNAERVTLGLKIAKETLTPVSVPTVRPIVQLKGVRSHTLRVELKDEATMLRVAKPRHVAGAQIYVHLGDEPPTQSSQWKFDSTRTSARFEITFEMNLPYGQCVWVCAAWIDTRGRPGPMSEPRSVRLLGGAIGPTGANLRAA